MEVGDNELPGTETDVGPLEPWQPPHHGLATRVPALKQEAKARGFSVFNNIIVYHESNLEKRVSTVIQARNDVAELHSQYPVFRFRDKDGKVCRHTCDFFVVLRDGTRIAVIVKMEYKRAAMEALADRIYDYGLEGKADKIVVMTGVDATHDDCANAETILWSRGLDAGEELDAVLPHIVGMAGEIRFGDLLRGAGNLAKRRTALWQLLDRGLLVPEEGKRIDELTWLISAEAAQQSVDLPMAA